jgi:hypothetical protein
MNTIRIKELRERIIAGVAKAHEKLIREYRASNEKIIISRNGKIERISASSEF